MHKKLEARKNKSYLTRVLIFSAGILLNVVVFFIIPKIILNTQWFKTYLKDEIKYLFQLDTGRVDFDDINLSFPLHLSISPLKIYYHEKNQQTPEVEVLALERLTLSVTF